MGDGLALDMLLAVFGRDPGLQLDVAREIREAVEGKATHRLEMVEPPVKGTREDVKKKLWAWVAEAEVERAKLFGMPIPEDTARMAREMGVELEGLPPHSETEPPTPIQTPQNQAPQSAQ